MPLPLTSLSTGVVLPANDADRLAGAKELEKQSMENFISLRIQSNEISFWDPIQTLKINSFQIKVNNQKEKMTSVSADRELISRPLVAVKTRDVDLKEVLSYELCAVPIAVAHPDGSLSKTTKSALMSILESEATCSQSLPSSPLPTATPLIQMEKSAGCTIFGELCLKYENILTTTLRCNSCSRVDLLFDQYREISIKQRERTKRESSVLTVNIYNGSTPVPKQWTKFILNPKIKGNLAESLCVFLSESLPTRLDASQKVVLAGGFKEGMKTVSVSKNSTVVEPDLISDNEEADTRLLLQAKNAAITHPKVVIQSPDIDVVILSVAHFEDLQC